MRTPRGRAGRSLVAVALLSSLVLPVAGLAADKAEEPELLTDRPDFTETSFVVPLRSLQIEAGFTYTSGDDGARVFNAPELLLRYGIGARTELRLGLPDYFTVRGGGMSASGFGDTYLGLKQQLGPSGARYGFALIPAVLLPTGAKVLTSDAVDPEIVLTWSRDLSELWSVGGIVGLAWPTIEGDRKRFLFPTVSFGRTLSDRWGTFLEWAAIFPEDSGDVHLLHHGYTYALSDVSQADVHLGFGLSSAAPDFFIGGGYAVRY
jgi:hypothetical protein